MPHILLLISVDNFFLSSSDMTVNFFKYQNFIDVLNHKIIAKYVERTCMYNVASGKLMNSGRIRALPPYPAACVERV